MLRPMGLTVRLDDPEETARLLSSFLSGYAEDSGAKGAVVGMSGGLDSSVVAALCVRAFGAKRVVGVALPSPTSPASDLAHAQLVAKKLGIDLRIAEVGPILEGVARSLGAERAADLERTTRGNVAARARMTVLYAIAQAEGRLVVGTGNKSELLTGYFTKYGDGGVDLLPIGDLYKTQVRELGRHLGIPAPILEKPPTAGLWDGQTDEEELGIGYAHLDRILLGLELQLPPATIAKEVGVPEKEVLRIEAKRRSTQHKRRGPLVPRASLRTVGIDWRAPVTEGAP